MTRHPTRGLVDRVLVHPTNLSAYEGVYVALAEALGYPLLTADRRLVAAPGPACERRLVAAPRHHR